MLKSPVQSLEVSYFVHATEDRAKVDRAVEDLVGGQAQPQADEVEGHFGNPIVVERLVLTGDEATAAARRLVSKMPAELRSAVRADLEGHMDEHRALYLRLDKQKLVAGEVALGDSDPVRLRLKPRLHALEGSADQFYRVLLE